MPLSAILFTRRYAIDVAMFSAADATPFRLMRRCCFYDVMTALADMLRYAALPLRHFAAIRPLRRYCHCYERYYCRHDSRLLILPLRVLRCRCRDATLRCSRCYGSRYARRLLMRVDDAL